MSMAFSDERRDFFLDQDALLGREISYKARTKGKVVVFLLICQPEAMPSAC